jgi:hypothetical protein
MMMEIHILTRTLVVVVVPLLPLWGTQSFRLSSLNIARRVVVATSTTVPMTTMLMLMRTLLQTAGQKARLMMQMHPDRFSTEILL